MQFFHSSLGGFNTKKLGLSVALTFLIVEFAIKIKGVVDESIIEGTNMLFLYGLILAVFSKEKVDDERFVAIRYFSLKFSLQLFLIAVFIDYIRKIQITPIYFAFGTLITYLIVYYTCVLFNPKFIFKEKTEESFSNLTVFITALILIAIAFSLLVKIFAM